MGLRFESRLLAAISVAVLVVTALSLTIWKIADDATQTARWVAHSQELLHLLARTRGSTLQIEFATQNYRLTGDSTHLQERDEAIESRETSLATIHQLVSDNQLQLRYWDTLRQVVDQRLAISRQVESIRRDQGLEAANAFVAKAPLKATRERIYSLLSSMDQEERRLLDLRKTADERSKRLFVWWGYLIATLLCLLLLGSYFVVRRQWQLTIKHHHDLAYSEQKMATTLRSIGEAMIATDQFGHITHMNSVAEQMIGRSEAEVSGKPIKCVISLLHEQTRERASLPIMKALETAETQAISEQVLVRADNGAELVLAGSVAPICDHAGHTHGTVVILRDVTKERSAEQIIREQNIQLTAHVDEQSSRLAESEAHLSNIINTVPAMIAYVDAEQRYVYVNEQYLTRFAPDQGDITGRSVADVLGDTRYAIATAMIDKVLSGVPQSYDWQPFPGVWQTIRYLPKRTQDGAVVGYYVLGTDITDRKIAEDKIQFLNMELAERVRELEHVTRALRTLSAGNRAMLRAQEELMLLDSMCQAIVEDGGYEMAIIWYCDDDPDSKIRPMAQRGFPGGFEALKKLQPRLTQSAQGQSVSPMAIKTGQVQVARNMPEDPNHASWRDQLHGSISSMACPLYVEGQVVGALTIYDKEVNAFAPDEITLLTELSEDLAFGIMTLRAQVERERVRSAMQHMLRYDALTGLANVFQFEQVLTTTLTKPAELVSGLAVIQLNIARLSEINDAFGFSHGDQVLCEFGKRLVQCVPQSALVARIRGDEFAVLLPEYDRNTALAAVENIERVFTQPFIVADIAVEVSACVGIALYPDHGDTAHDLLRCVDNAVHQAKKSHLPHAVYDGGLPQAEATKLTLVAELRRAIEQEELRLYLQPKVSFSTGQICGAEALVRWEHPQRGLLFPGTFIEVAEQTGLIKPLTEWMIRAALAQLQQWQRKNIAMPIAVNLSARNLRDELLINKIIKWQSTYGIAPGLLELELTESSIMEDADFALQLLHEIKKCGIKLYIDDFGTGYSSLSYLQKLPVDYIKIDQSFVSNMQSNASSAMIVRSTIELVKNLDRMTVAEGVETIEQWNELASLGCDYAQDYLIAKPMPAALFDEWARDFSLEHYIGEHADMA